jgi:hypothetical protein
MHGSNSTRAGVGVYAKLNWDGAFKCARRSLGEEEDM